MRVSRSSATRSDSPPPRSIDAMTRGRQSAPAPFSSRPAAVLASRFSRLISLWRSCHAGRARTSWPRPCRNPCSPAGASSSEITVALTALAIWTLVVQDRLHQLAVVAHHRALAGGEAERLGPAEPDARCERSRSWRLHRLHRVAGHVEPGNAELPAGPGDRHDRVQYRGRRLCSHRAPWPRASKPTQSTAAVDLRLAEDLGDLSASEASCVRSIGLAAKAARLRQALGNHVAHNHHCRARATAPRRARPAPPGPRLPHTRSSPVVTPAV